MIAHAEAVGRYQALPEGDIFDMEYWSLEQAKLGKSKPKPLDGRDRVHHRRGARHRRGDGARVRASRARRCTWSIATPTPLAALASELALRAAKSST